MTPVSDRLTAALADRYRIERSLGEGGMATVYLADDLKHERKVAIKVLKPELAAVIGGERFLTEIRTTANLQHPHILPLFDSGEADSFLYYVMPYIEGESLRGMMDREKQLSVDDAVSIARDIAEALDYAHRHDVIHRDIKPENILIHDGNPVVADFGIALAVSAAGGGRMTETGLSLGTPHYMSPEQASADRDLSNRSDIYSLGCMLYEMLAGQPPHTGPSAQSVLVRILTEQPRPLSEERHSVPPHVSAVVMKAIEKLPADRFATAEEFSKALENRTFTYTAPMRAVTGVVGAAAPARPSSSWLSDSRSKLAVGALVLLAGVVGWGFLAPEAEVTRRSPGVVSFVLQDEAGAFDFPPAIGPKGEILARGSSDVRQGFTLQAPGSLEPRFLEDTEYTIPGAAFSPDGEWVVFWQGEPTGANSFGNFSLRRMPAGGGPISTLWTPGEDWAFEFGSRLDWSDDGWIYTVLRSQNASAIGRIPQEGGEPEILLETADGARTLATLPGGRGLVAGFVDRVIALDLESGDTVTVVEDGFDPQWVSSGHLIYAHSEGALYALPFDPRSLQATGPAVPVLDDVAVQSRGLGRYRVSPNGMLAYIMGDPAGGAGPGSNSRFELVALGGEVEQLPLEPTDHGDGAVSPDGRLLAYTRDDHIWLYDIDRGTNRQFTETGTNHHNPIWSPDGTRVAFSSQRDGDNSADIYIKPVDGSSGARRAGGTDALDAPVQWLEGGSILTGNWGGQRDIRSLSVDDGSVEAVLEADWLEAHPKVSPDGQWFAYVSSEDGSAQLYVRRWPDLSDKVQVTTGPGQVYAAQGQVAWSDDSRTIYFNWLPLGPGGTTWSATMTDTDGLSFEVEDTGLTGETLRSILWGRTPDGRLLMERRGASTTDDDEDSVAKLVIISNWLDVLEERLGTGN